MRRRGSCGASQSPPPETAPVGPLLRRGALRHKAAAATAQVSMQWRCLHPVSAWNQCIDAAAPLGIVRRVSPLACSRPPPGRQRYSIAHSACGRSPRIWPPCVGITQHARRPGGWNGSRRAARARLSLESS